MHVQGCVVYHQNHEIYHDPSQPKEYHGYTSVCSVMQASLRSQFILISENSKSCRPLPFVQFHFYKTESMHKHTVACLNTYTDKCVCVRKYREKGL